MTTFDADLHRLATQLATMTAAPAITTAADDTDLVNRARRTLRNCCRTMLADLAPLGPNNVAGPVRLADLALNPVGVLHTLLHRDPGPLTLSPPARTAADVTETANDHWKRLGDAAEIVTHEWASSDPTSRPTGEQAWTRIADVAALAQAAVSLDRAFVEADTGAAQSARRQRGDRARRRTHPPVRHQRAAPTAWAAPARTTPPRAYTRPAAR